jgi:DNA polymerase I
MPPFVLVDGSYFLFRAFHALPPLTTSTDLHTNAIRGAISAIQITRLLYVILAQNKVY